MRFDVETRNVATRARSFHGLATLRFDVETRNVATRLPRRNSLRRLRFDVETRNVATRCKPMDYVPRSIAFDGKLVYSPI